METPSAAVKTKRSRKKNRRGAGKLTVDDLTNLSWVAGTPVPMDSSVTPQDGLKRAAANSASAESSLKKLVLKKKLFKKTIPTCKIVLKDHKDQADNISGGSSDCSSPEKEDSAVIFANVMNENPSECNDPVDYDLLVDTVISSEDLDPKEPCSVTVSTVEKGVAVEENLDELKSYIKPNCSYTCLIGMALKASSGCLPVNAIYQYIEKEFPYFMTAPDGWKNSVRHNLSLNPIFRKVNPDGWFGKKGHLWEVCPSKQSIVDREIERFLSCTGKTLTKYSAPIKANFTRTRQYNKRQSNGKMSGRGSTKTPILCSRCTKIVSPIKHDLSSFPISSSPSSTSLDDSPNNGMEDIRNYCQDIKDEVRSCQIQVKPRLKGDTEAIFDSSECPLRQAGINSPPHDSRGVASDLFGFSSPDQLMSPMNYPGHFLPFYPPYGISMEGFSGAQTPCVSSGSSTSSASSPYGPPIATYPMPALPLQYMMWGHYPQFYNAMLAREMSGEADDYGSITPPTPTEAFKVSDLLGMANSALYSSPKKRTADNSGSPDVSSLNSPMKKMKVKNDGMTTAEESGTSYFGDASNSEAFSDGSQASEDEQHYTPFYWSLLPDFMSGMNYYNPDMNEMLANYATAPTKKDLEEIVGESDLKTLLENSYKFLPKNDEGKLADKVESTEDSPVVAECVSSLDSQSNEAEVTSSQQKEPFSLPTLDSLLQIGDNTILTINSAMLDVQNTVEVVTSEDTTTALEEGSEEAPSITVPA